MDNYNDYNKLFQTILEYSGLTLVREGNAFSVYGDNGQGDRAAEICKDAYAVSDVLNTAVLDNIDKYFYDPTTDDNKELRDAASKLIATPFAELDERIDLGAVYDMQEAQHNGFRKPNIDLLFDANDSVRSEAIEAFVNSAKEYSGDPVEAARALCPDDFVSDYDKMFDFKNLEEAEFLDSYSYLPLDAYRGTEVIVAYMLSENNDAYSFKDVFEAMVTDGVPTALVQVNGMDKLYNDLLLEPLKQIEQKANAEPKKTAIERD